MTGTLYVVGTPIGNLGDLSPRAVATLQSVETIFCEDTRVAKKLLSRHSISTPCVSYHTYSGFGKMRKASRLLREGRDVALIADAGTPTIADPGVRLVRHVRDTAPQTPIVTVPGPSAVTAALSVSGAPASSFVFLGFLPRKKGRKRCFSDIAQEERTVVFYEAPHRLLKTLQSLEDALPGDREVIVVREMTKVHECVVSGTAGDVFAHYRARPEEVRGEAVIIISSLATPSA